MARLVGSALGGTPAAAETDPSTLSDRVRPAGGTSPVSDDGVERPKQSFEQPFIERLSAVGEPPEDR